MKILILGATGATGKLAVKQIISKNINVKIVVRDFTKVNPEILEDELVECIQGNVLDFNDEELKKLAGDCDGVVSCLGHNITLKGIFGKPRSLVEDSIKQICKAVASNKNKKVKIVLMSSTAIRNRKVKENYSKLEKLILFLLGIFLPPHKDNEKAAEYLIKQIGRNHPKIEWCAVRPDALINKDKESVFVIFESPDTGPVFKPGKTSRINVGLFMTELLLNDTLWQKWRYRMPVIYNK